MKSWRTLLGAVLAAFAVGGAAGPSAAAPAQIIFLRHAEKPETGNELSERGWERARALVKLFTADPRVLEHGAPAVILAMKQAKAGSSVRAIQTVAPTARTLGVVLDARFTRDEISAVAQALLALRGADGKTVVVCWEHDAIPKIVAALGWTTGPKEWPGKSYDRLWLLDFENGRPVRFRDLPQRLLPGDKAK